MRDWVELRAGLALIVAVGLAALPGCASAPAATPERGQVVYSNYCAQCHKADGVGQESVGAPSIAGLPEWYVYEQLTKFRSGVRGAHYDDIEGLRMRPMALTLRTDDDVRAVSMHVASMAPVGTVATVHGDTAKGAAAFATCTACHGADGRGNEALGAPPLTLQPDWYLVRQLGKFKAGVRGANPKDVRGNTMRPMAATLVDEQAMADVVSHVMTLR
jgi:cytochrome c553